MVWEKKNEENGGRGVRNRGEWGDEVKGKKARGRGKGGGEEKEEKQEEGVENFTFDFKSDVLRGDVPSSTRDMVTQPVAGLPASILNMASYINHSKSVHSVMC